MSEFLEGDLPVRSFDTPNPVLLTAELATGALSVTASLDGTSTVRITPRDSADPRAVDYAREIRVEGDSRRVKIAAPTWRKGGRGRGKHPAILVSVTVPAGSILETQMAAVDIDVTVPLAKLTVAAGVSTINATDITGDVSVKIGAGGVTLGAVDGRVEVRAGTSEVAIRSARGGVQVRSGAGSVRLGAAAGDVLLHTGAGSLSIGELGVGRCKAHIGAGDIDIAVVPGIAVHMDLHSGVGAVRSELTPQSAPPSAGSDLDIRLQTGVGDVLLRSAVAV